MASKELIALSAKAMEERRKELIAQPLSRIYPQLAEAAAGAIRAALQEPTEGMEAAAQARVKGFHDIPARDWRSSTPKDFFRIAWCAMLAASALGEQSE